MKDYSRQHMTTYNHRNIQTRKTVINISNLLNYKNNASFPLHHEMNLFSSPSRSLIQNQKHHLKQHFKSSKLYRYQQHLAYQHHLNQEQKLQGSRSIPQYSLQITCSFFGNRHSSSTSHYFPWCWIPGAPCDSFDPDLRVTSFVLHLFSDPWYERYRTVLDLFPGRNSSQESYI
jgi:hypothetical protein